MLARLIAVFIDEVRRELRKFDDRPEPESAQDVSATMVGGRVLMAEGKVETMDEAAVVRGAQDILDAPSV